MGESCQNHHLILTIAEVQGNKIPLLFIFSLFVFSSDDDGGGEYDDDDEDSGIVGKSDFAFRNRYFFIFF